MNDLGVTIRRRPFEHMVYHFVLTYSNWQWATICFSESFESLSEGLQESLWQLGGVPDRHRSDRLSAAVNNLSDRREFTSRYGVLMDHYPTATSRVEEALHQLPTRDRLPGGDFGFLASPDDGPSVGILRVLFAWLSLWSSRLSSLPLTRCHGRLPSSSPLGVDFLNCLSWTEDKRFGLAGLEKWLQDGLGFRADGNSPRLAMVLVFVSIRLVDPDILRHVDIAGPHVPDVLRSHSCEFLYLHHCPDNVHPYSISSGRSAYRKLLISPWCGSP